MGRMATLADRIKKKQAPQQGFGDMRVAEEQGLQAPEGPEAEFAPASPAEPEDMNKPLQIEEAKDPAKLANRIRESDSTLNELQDLSNQYEKDRIVPKDRTDELKAAIAGARDLHGRNATRNDWMQVAQTLSRAIAQFGAAASGQNTNRNLAGLDFGPGIDYEARSNRSLREFELERQGLKDQVGTARQREEDEAQRQKEVFSAKSKPLEDKLSTQRAREKSQDDYDKAIELAKMQGDREALRNRLRDKQQDDRDANRDKGEELRDLRSQLKLKQDELKASTTAANMLSNMDDLSSKSVHKLETQLPGVLGKAGITPEDIAQIEQESQVPGKLWGTNTDTDKRNQIIKQKLVEKKKGEINSLMQAINSLSKRRDSSGGSAAKPVAPSPEKAAPEQSGGMVRMKAPNGQVGEIPADKVQDAEAKGFTRI